MSQEMEVDANNAFLNESSDDSDKDDTTQNDQQTATKKTQKFTHPNKFENNTNTVLLFPIVFEKTEIDIYNFVKIAGKPTGISLVTSKKKTKVTDQSSKHYRARIAYVSFKTNEEASAAVEKLNRKDFGGLATNVKYTSPTKRGSSDLAGKTQWVRISGLAHETTEQDILDAISASKQIQDPPQGVYLFQHPENSDYTGHCYLQFKSEKDASNCVDKINLKKINDKQVYVTFKFERKGLEERTELAGQTKRVLIANVHYKTQESEIEELCKSFGEIEQVQVWRDAFGFPKGFASVTMNTTEEATAVYAGLKGVSHKNMDLVTAYTPIKAKRAATVKDMKKTLLKNKSVRKRVNTGGKRRSPMNKKGKTFVKGNRRGGGKKQFS